jgi:hypothetical protein
MVAAAATYKELYGNKHEGADSSGGSRVSDGSRGAEMMASGIPATFQLLYFIGWKPHPSQVSHSPHR